MTQRLPSCIALMPENPCRGWPLNGVETPVGREADLSEMYDVPGIVPTASMRRQSGLVYLPETANAAARPWAGAARSLGPADTRAPRARPGIAVGPRRRVEPRAQARMIRRATMDAWRSSL